VTLLAETAPARLAGDRGGGAGEFTGVLRVSRVERPADGVLGLTLTDPGGAPLPPWQPGAHLDLCLTDDLVRQYSLCGDPDDRSCYEIAVLREPASRGGSAYVHDRVREGDAIRVNGLRNHFPLERAADYVFIAGGIGITPLLPMIAQANRSGSRWRLLYGGRTRASMAFLDRLAPYGDAVAVRPQDEAGLLDLGSVVDHPRPGCLVYCCGPEPLLAAVEARCAAWSHGALHVERFTPRPLDTGPDTAFEVELARTGAVVPVPVGTSIVDALATAGAEVETSCREGTCGTCETAVLAGTPDHRDSVLSDEERAGSRTMMLCVSRSRSSRLVLDL
jgi:ferredoxin-NADP reductase